MPIIETKVPIANGLLSIRVKDFVSIEDMLMFAATKDRGFVGDYPEEVRRRLIQVDQGEE